MTVQSARAANEDVQRRHNRRMQDKKNLPVNLLNWAKRCRATIDKRDWMFLVTYPGHTQTWCHVSDFVDIADDGEVVVTSEVLNFCEKSNINPDTLHLPCNRKF